MNVLDSKAYWLTISAVLGLLACSHEPPGQGQFLIQSHDSTRNNRPGMFDVIRLETDGLPGGYVNDLNDDGLIVGWRPHPVHNRVAAVWLNGKLQETGRLENVSSEAHSIADDGTVVGHVSFNKGSVQGFILDRGILIEPSNDNDALAETSLFGVSNRSRAFGTVAENTDATRAVYWSRQSSFAEDDLEFIPVPSNPSAAHATNSKGVTVGEYFNAVGMPIAYSWSPESSFRELTAFGQGCKAFGINDKGVIVGGSFHSDGYQTATKWVDNQPRELFGLADSSNSWSFDINDSNWIVGWSTNAVEQQLGVLWANNEIFDLNQLVEISGTVLVAKAINNRNEIAAIAQFDGEKLPAPVLLRPKENQIEPDSQTDLCEIFGHWIVDWRASSKLCKEPERAQELLMIQNVVGANRLISLRRRSKHQLIDCSVLAKPLIESWEHAELEKIGSCQWRLGEITILYEGRDRLIVEDNQGTETVFVRDNLRLRDTKVEVTNQAIADMFQSSTARFIRLSQRYDWGEMNADASNRLQDFCDILNLQLQSENNQRVSSFVENLRFRQSWLKQHVLPLVKNMIR